jgi:hypothetical protein
MAAQRRKALPRLEAQRTCFLRSWRLGSDKFLDVSFLFDTPQLAAG